MATAGKVLIGGGTGFVGKAIRRRLDQRGYECISVSRSAGPGQLTWRELKSRGLPENCQAVISLQGENILNPLKFWTHAFKEEVWNSRVSTTLALVNAVLEAKEAPECFLSISGVGIYPPDRTIMYTETSKVSGEHDFLSSLASTWESAAFQAKDRCRTVVIRSGVVLGREGGMIAHVQFPFMVGLGGRTGHGYQPFPWIHVDDLASLFVFAMDHPDLAPSGTVFNGVAPVLDNNRDFAKTYAEALHRPAFIPLFSPFVYAMFGPERAKMMLEGQRVVPKAVLDAGFEYEFPTLRDACQELVSGGEF
ncbi:unnamed protein product [Cyprideis torosa]|uniref:Uncharacterized protein n=1 Tax=Cyprideis torosa TaxID=163714 RepID=A0A7R8WCP2_9CRUS|nr:unnamed protein product [Cyprideis torosa]CAG0893612.1 unnamed protein product [Cyprideis torosa]